MLEIPPSLPHAFQSVVKGTPDKVLLHFEGQSYTYTRIHEHVGAVAGSLRAWGLRKGDRVALYLENSPSFISAYLGVLQLGGVVVPVNTRYRETEVTHMLTDSGARLVVTDRAGRDTVEAVRGKVTSVDAVVELGLSLPNDSRAWQELATGDPVREPTRLSPTDTAVLGYTSGTTGRSKGAVLTHGNFCANSAAVTQAWGWTPDDHLLLALPLFHTHGLAVGLHGTLLQSSTVTLKRSFDAGDTFREMLRGEVSMFFGVPTMYTRLIEEAEKHDEKPDLRLLVSGSAPLSPYTLQKVEELFGLRILERYGMTETVMNLGNPLAGERRAGSIGFPFEGVEVRIADPDTGTVQPDFETGELQLRGPNISRGYWNNEAATRDSRTSDGWFRTGDLGYRDTEGYHYLNGRAKELIISGGFNVYPREVEEVLEAHEGVAEVAVLGLPDADLGERIAAAVVRREAQTDSETLQAFCKERLASFKKPKEVYFVEALPRNALGKVQKHLLREEFLKG